MRILRLSTPFLSQPCARPGLRFWSPLQVATCPMQCWGSAVGGVADDLGIKERNHKSVPGAISYFVRLMGICLRHIFKALFARGFRVPIARCRQQNHGNLDSAISMAINSQLVGKILDRIVTLAKCLLFHPFPFTLHECWGSHTW